MASVYPHTALSVYVQDGQVAIQPRGPPTNSQIDTLSINLDTGKVQVVPAAPQPGSSLDALAVLGVCKLHAGNALLIATAAKPVAQLGGADIYEVVEAKVVTSAAAKKNKCNQGLLRLLEDAVDPKGAGRGLYFSYYKDITLITQRAAALAIRDPQLWSSQLPVQRASGRYFWNKAIAAPLLSAGAQAFVQPCMLGFVQQLPELQFREPTTGKTLTGTLTLIARRAVARAGTRQWRRGADTSGSVANFAETEQILTIDGPAGHPLTGTQASYVLTRGSIPLLWTQLPNIKYKPTTVIAPAELSGPAHDKHFTDMVARYDSVVAINLINHHGTEGKLEAAFRQEATRLIGSGSSVGEALRYIAFDFHAECGNKRYHRLSLLWDQIVEDFNEQSFCMLGGSGTNGNAANSVKRTQSGVFRVNCIDCLDRTNVVQGVLARKSLEAVLSSLGLLGKGVALPEAYPEVERQFKILWADHGDALSTQYAGTGAMKSGFTRTGKRTIGGVIDDGVKAVVRYYLNNYQDGIKQDAIDLITGAYQCDTINVPPLKAQPSPLIPVFLSLLALGVATHNVVAVLGHYLGSNVPPTIALEPSEVTQPHGLLGSARRLAASVLYSPPIVSAAAEQSITRVPAAATLGDAATAGSMQEAAATSGGFLSGIVTPLTAYVFVPLALGAGLLFLVIKNGKYLVNRPQLCPQLAVTVQRPAKESKKAA